MRAASATTATSSSAPTRQQRSSSRLVRAAPRLASARPVNFASRSASVIGRARLPIACSIRFSTTRPSAKVSVTVAASGASAGSTAARTRRRRSITAGSRTARSLNCRSPPSPSISATEAAWNTLNLPSSPVCGSVLPVSSSTSGCTRSATERIEAASMPSRLRSCTQASITG